MLKKLIYLCIMANLALLLQSCCDEGAPYPITINITSVPKQDSVLIWGIKNGKALAKVLLKGYYNDRYFPTIQSYPFYQSLDMTGNNSTLVIQYYDKDKILQTDTITISYTRGATYQRNCGAYVYISNAKIEKSTTKLPITITINR